MTSNLINSLCLFSPALLTVTRDEEQNKQGRQSQSMGEQEQLIHDGKHSSIWSGCGEGGLFPMGIDTAPFLHAPKTFIHIILPTPTHELSELKQNTHHGYRVTPALILSHLAMLNMSICLSVKHGRSWQQEDVTKPLDHKQWLPYPLRKEISFGAASRKAGTIFLQAGCKTSLTESPAKRCYECFSYRLAAESRVTTAFRLQTDNVQHACSIPAGNFVIKNINAFIAKSASQQWLNSSLCGLPPPGNCFKSNLQATQ